LQHRRDLRHRDHGAKERRREAHVIDAEAPDGADHARQASIPHIVQAERGAAEQEHEGVVQHAEIGVGPGDHDGVAGVHIHDDG
jgi:hypothetical protein